MTSHTMFDWERGERTGVPEVVLAEHKTIAQLSDIASDAMSRGRPLLMTRLTPAQIEGYDAVISLAVRFTADTLRDAKRLVTIARWGVVSSRPLGNDSSSTTSSTIQISPSSSASVCMTGASN